MKMLCLVALTPGAAAGTAGIRRRTTTEDPTRAGVEASSLSSLATASGSDYNISTSTSTSSAIIGQTTTAEERVAQGEHGSGGSPSESGVVFFSIFGFLLAFFLLYHVIQRCCRKHGLGGQGRGRVDGGQRPREGSNAVPRQGGWDERGGRAGTGGAGAAPIADQGLVPMIAAN